MKKLKTIKLRIHHFIFFWYYKRCGEHFRQWTFIKSVRLLIDNYNHLQLLHKNEITHNRNLTRDNDEMRDQLFQIKMKQIASDSQLNWINDMFGTNIHKNTEN